MLGAAAARGTPSMRMNCVPAPVIFAPIAFSIVRQARDLRLAGGVDDRRLAFASVAASMTLSVPMTLG